MAAGIVGDITKPEIGLLKFYIKEWGTDGSAEVKWKELKSRNCEPDDFEADESTGVSRYGFYPLNSRTEYWTTYRSNFQCIDEPYDVYGNWNTNTGGNLMIVFERCDPE